MRFLTRDQDSRLADTRIPLAPRPKWHLVYFLLATFDLLTVLASLWLSDRILGIYRSSVAVNQEWAERLGRYSQLGRLASAVNIPGNDVIASRDVAAESAKLRASQEAFDASLSAACNELSGHSSKVPIVSLLHSLATIRTEMADVVSEANAIFTFIDNDERDEANKHVASMDQEYDDVVNALAVMCEVVLAIQKDQFDQQLAVATSLRMLHRLIIGFVVIMVVGVTTYGHMLARGMNASVSEREQHLRAIRRNEERTRAIIDSAMDCIISMDREGKIIEFNPAAEATFRYPRSHALGKPLVELIIPPAWRERYRAGLARYLTTAEAPIVGTRIQMPALRADGSEFPAEVTMTAVGEAAETIFTAYLHDITDRKKAEDSLQLSNENLKSSLKELENRSRELMLLTNMGQMLATTLTPEEAHRVIAKFASQLFPNWSGALYLLSPSGNVVEAATSWGKSPPPEHVFAPDDCWALRNGRLHSIVDREIDLHCAHLEHSKVPSLCLPMTARSDILGMICLQGPECADGQRLPHESAKQTSERLAIALAEQVSLALSNLELRDKLRTQALRDPLTGLCNRRYLEETLEREIRRAERKRVPVSVVMIDIDRFKQFNDSFGHAAGDALLQQFGVFLQTRVRADDIACRYGGEEFALVLPDASLDVSCERAELLREGVKELRIEYLRQHLGPVTMSIGVSLFPDHGDNPEALIRAADAALYRAKRTDVTAWKSPRLLTDPLRLTTRRL